MNKEEEEDLVPTILGQQGLLSLSCGETSQEYEVPDPLQRLEFISLLGQHALNGTKMPDA
jgi:hypothetical protein